ncbi:hypothetical protein [Proteiniphilum propionicum]|uniref:hypothetical protein n=1 Tax=Proteiniphilum propionicum TaxID=2829812 RepID=UPI001EEC113B|nr:hypothetical protein [Proteiniphilum propionicum]
MKQIENMKQYAGILRLGYLSKKLAADASPGEYRYTGIRGLPGEHAYKRARAATAE